MEEGATKGCVGGGASENPVCDDGFVLGSWLAFF